MFENSYSLLFNADIVLFNCKVLASKLLFESAFIICPIQGSFPLFESREDLEEDKVAFNCLLPGDLMQKYDYVEVKKGYLHIQD
jgi:hypothetical protein